MTPEPTVKEQTNNKKWRVEKGGGGRDRYRKMRRTFHVGWSEGSECVKCVVVFPYEHTTALTGVAGIGVSSSPMVFGGG